MFKNLKFDLHIFSAINYLITVTNITFGTTKTANVGIIAEKKVSKTEIHSAACIKIQPVRKIMINIRSIFMLILA